MENFISIRFPNILAITVIILGWVAVAVVATQVYRATQKGSDNA